MRIATTNKQTAPLSGRYRRSRAGSKGIGRLAARRLGRQISVTSVAAGENPRSRVSFEIDWSTIAVGAELEQVHVVVHESETTEPAGTTIEIGALSDRWTKQPFDMLVKQLATLAGPDTGDKTRNDPGFELAVTHGELPVTAPSSVSDAIRDSGWGRARGEIRDGFISVRLEGLDHLQESAQWAATDVPDRVAIDFDIAWMSGVREYRRAPNLLTNQVYEQVVKERGGLRLYLDGFRVDPYGQRGDDWLGTAGLRASRSDSIADHLLKLTNYDPLATRRAGLSRPTPRQLLGEVRIKSSGSTEFVSTTSREGLLETDGFRGLRQALTEVIDWMVIHYKATAYARRQRELDRSRRVALARLRSHREQTAPDVASIAQEIARIGRILADAGVAEGVDLAAAGNSVADSVNIYRVALAASSMANSVTSIGLTFAHDVDAIVPLLEEISTGVATVESIKKNRERSGHALEFLLLLRRMLNDMSTQVQDSSPLARPAEALSNTLSSLTAYARSLKTAEPEWAKPVNWVERGVVCTEAEYTSIVLNALTNAIKSAATKRGGRVSAELAANAEGLSILVSNTGPAVDLSNQRQLFSPLVSDPDEEIYPLLRRRLGDANFSKGTGLGLYLMQAIVASWSGRCEFIEPAAGFSTRMEVVIPWHTQS